MKPKARRNKEINKDRNQWNRKQINNREKSIKPKADPLKRSNKLINLWLDSHRNKKEKTQITKIRNERISLKEMKDLHFIRPKFIP